MPNIFDFPSKLMTTQAVIANGASLSGVVNLGGTSVLAVIMPASWTAANLTVQASMDGVNFYDLYTASGTEFMITAAASRCLMLQPADVLGARYVKLRSGTAAAAVTQGAERVVTLVTRAL